MSGPFGSSQWMYSSGGFYPYEIEQSLRFNDDDSAYLSRTPASAGNRKTWTWSGWVKRGNLGSAQTLLGANTTFVEITSADKIQFDRNGTTVATSAVFRDPSAWYHVVVAVDTTQATAADRTEIYVNGTIQAVTGSYVSQNTDTDVNNATQHNIGANLTPAEYFDGYMAEVNFIDGSALDPTSFGEFKSDIWIPKEYSGSYGTNGFYLTFEDSAAIGDDLSGNTNDWTANNLVSTDVLLDSPTQNYCVWSVISKLTTGTLSDGNLSSTGAAIGTIPATAHQSYWEITANAASVVGGVKNEAGTEHTIAIANTKTFGFRVDSSGDLDYINITDGGSWTNITTGLTGDWFPYAEGGANTLNAGQLSFAATPPSDFLPLNTANLPAPAIDPAADDVPADYFNTVLYTGNGSTQSITGVGFQPDWTWIKGRSGATDHALYDAVRGVQEQLESNQTGAETTEATGLTAFGADGFSVGALAQLNTSTATYVAWNWLAGNGTSSNTDGTITSTVSVNQKAGFSVVGYSGNSTAGATIGHGLGSAPDMIIVKNRTDGTQNWRVQHSSLGPNQGLSLNATDAAAAAIYWNSTAPTSSVFSVDGSAKVNASGDDYIAYCFAEVEGYSKFGSYTGNSSSDGPFVYTGFRPAWVMIKQTNAANPWMLYDDVRLGYNEDNDFLQPNANNAEVSGPDTAQVIDILSNGFKLRNTAGKLNGSGSSYIFMCFSSNPFKYANAR